VAPALAEHGQALHGAGPARPPAAAALLPAAAEAAPLAAAQREALESQALADATLERYHQMFGGRGGGGEAAGADSSQQAVVKRVQEGESGEAQPAGTGGGTVTDDDREQALVCSGEPDSLEREVGPAGAPVPPAGLQAALAGGKLPSNKALGRALDAPSSTGLKAAAAGGRLLPASRQPGSARLMAAVAVNSRGVAAAVAQGRQGAAGGAAAVEAGRLRAARPKARAAAVQAVLAAAGLFN
jgi:hypothetical protein